MTDTATIETTKKPDPYAASRPKAQPKWDAEQPQQPKLPALKEKTSLKLFEQVRRVWHVKAPAGATPHDLLLPRFWKIVADKVQRHDIVLVIADDESWEVEARVEHATPDGIEVSISKKMSRKAMAIRSTILGDGRFVTGYQNGSWCVMRTSDGYPTVTGYQSEQAAIAEWIKTQPRKV